MTTPLLLVKIKRKKLRMPNNKNETTGLIGWIDERFPLSSFIKNHLTEYYAPKNFNFWYFFGALALFVFVMQILTGIFLTMHYKPDAALAFASVEYIMRDVSFGWLIRYLHSTGASLFFVVIYLHMFSSGNCKLVCNHSVYRARFS